MKKIAILAFSVLLAGGVTETKAQDNPNESKSLRFGLQMDPSLSWYSPVDKKKHENAGIRPKMALGAALDFKLAENVWFATGLRFSFLGGKVGYLENSIDTIGYYINNAREDIYSFKDLPELDSLFFTQNSFIRLNEREFRVRYLTIPLMFKMKTKEIGYLTYFGQIGALLNVKMGSVKGNDVGINMTNPQAVNYQDLIIDKESSFLNAALNVGFGAEYNLSGSTSLFGSLNFSYGLTGVVNKKSNQLVMGDYANNPAPYQMAKGINNHVISLSIGVLF
jgi:hypothetical protein